MGRGIGENEPQIMVRFRNALDGPPMSWVPLHCSPSLVPSLLSSFVEQKRNEPPTSLWKGEGLVWLVAVFLWLLSSDVPAQAWPESPGFGLALGGLGLRKS
jgi:hypothetical protein